MKDGVRLRIPKHKANASLGYDICKNSFVSLNYQFVGSRTDINFSTYANEARSSYSLVDLYFSHKLIKNKLKLFANVTNVFNEDYFEILGYTTRGRNVSLGLNLNL
ncbi:TonB-dependent receptor domain-containing protein [Algibacter sp.]|uniref:TonB-dependent receptor domain-containing protein n=1 Tax=Algibacter sp. TaxID=1872428 RepID=UPI003C70E2D9